VHDADVEVARFVYENLTELVDVLEADGRKAAANVTAHAGALVAAHHEREAVASKITALAAMVGRPRPGDVSRSRCEPLLREATRLVAAGGELPPTLDRDPRGELVEAAS
jgi:hypothetical protein